jgi:NitT/TauT family transport system substrate-binding protein
LVPLNFVALDAGYSNLGNAYDYLPEIAFISILVDDTWARANREVLINVLAAIREATDMAYDPANDETSLSLVNEVVRTDLKYVRQSLDLLRDNNMMPRDLSVPAGALATSIRLMRSAGLLPQQTVKDPQGTIDDSYRQAALAITG